jgi:lysozyme family protein
MSTHTYENYKDGYIELFRTCKITQDPSFYINKILKNKTRYQQVGIFPWDMIGCIHALEAGFRFDRHLHNGDPLTAKTVNVPKGRPLGGSPPYTWEYSAKDALSMKRQPPEWTIAGKLYILESFNGFGYRRRNINTPYLWSFSNHYTKGKFVKDGIFDPTAVSKQCGAAVILKRLAELGHIEDDTKTDNVDTDPIIDIIQHPNTTINKNTLNPLQEFILQFSQILNSLFKK